MRGYSVLLAIAALCLVNAALPSNPLGTAFQRLRNGRVTQAGMAAETKMVMIYYGASWCGPCRAFVPELIAAYATLRARDVEVLFVSDDATCPAALDYARTSRMPWLLLPCDRQRQSQLRALGGRALPGIVVLDQHGRLVRSSWQNPDSSAPHRVLTEMLRDRR